MSFQSGTVTFVNNYGSFAQAQLVFSPAFSAVPITLDLIPVTNSPQSQKVFSFTAEKGTLTTSGVTINLTSPGNTIGSLVVNWTASSGSGGGGGGSGDVNGPSSSVDGTLAAYSGTTGKLIQNASRISATANTLQSDGTGSMTLNANGQTLILSSTGVVLNSNLNMGTNSINNLVNGVNPQDGAAFGQVSVKANLVAAPTNGDILVTNGLGQPIDSAKVFSTDVTLGGVSSSNSNIPTQLAVKTFVNNATSNIYNFIGMWNASTNTPTLADGTGTLSDTYVVNVAGSQNLGHGLVAYNVGDLVVYTAGNIWDVIPEGNIVLSVNGQTGIVTLALAQLSDTTIIAPANAQALIFNSGSGDWENAVITYGSISGTPTLGTAAAFNVGTANTNIPQLTASGLPAVSGQNLTGLTKAQVGLSNVPNVDATNLANDTIQGTFTPVNAAIVTGDTGAAAFAKAQGQIAAIVPGIPTTAQVTTVDNETGTLPNSRRWVNGVNSTVNTTTSGQIALDVSAGGSGNVTGPVGAVNNHLTTFSGVTGLIIQDATTISATANTLTGSGTAAMAINAGGSQPLNITASTLSVTGGGLFGAPINMSSQKINLLATGTASTDAANVGQIVASTAQIVTVDNESVTSPNSRQLIAGTNIAFNVTTPNQLVISSTAAGGGNVTGPTAPTITNHVATYADTTGTLLSKASTLSLSANNITGDGASAIVINGTSQDVTITAPNLNVSGTIVSSGQINMTSQKVINLLTGTASTDAANVGQIVAKTSAFTTVDNETATYVNSRQWVNGAHTTINTATTGQIAADVSMTLENLTDVVVTTPVSGQVLEWNGTDWINATPTSGGNVVSTSIPSIAKTPVLYSDITGLNIVEGVQNASIIYVDPTVGLDTNTGLNPNDPLLTIAQALTNAGPINAAYIHVLNSNALSLAGFNASNFVGAIVCDSQTSVGASTMVGCSCALYNMLFFDATTNVPMASSAGSVLSFFNCSFISSDNLPYTSTGAETLSFHNCNFTGTALTYAGTVFAGIQMDGANAMFDSMCTWSITQNTANASVTTLAKQWFTANGSVCQDLSENPAQIVAGSIAVRMCDKYFNTTGANPTSVVSMFNTQTVFSPFAGAACPMYVFIAENCNVDGTWKNIAVYPQASIYDAGSTLGFCFLDTVGGNKTGDSIYFGAGFAGTTAIPDANFIVADVNQTTDTIVGTNFFFVSATDVQPPVLGSGVATVTLTNGVGQSYPIFRNTVVPNVNGVATPLLLFPTDTGKFFTNGGTAEESFFTLPDALTSIGVTYTFCCVNAFGLRVVASGTDTIVLETTTSAAGGFYETTIPVTTATLVSIGGGTWVVSYQLGTGAVT